MTKEEKLENTIEIVLMHMERIANAAYERNATIAGSVELLSRDVQANNAILKDISTSLRVIAHNLTTRG